MNKKLRRLLRRKQSSRDNSSLEKNTNETPALSSLLAERSSAKPNYYFRTGNSVHDDTELKKSDANSEDKDILIVEDAKNRLTDENSDVELQLEPMASETVTVQLNPIPNKNNFDSIPNDPSSGDKESHRAQAKLIKVSKLTPSEHKKVENLPLLTKSSYKNENPYSPSPLVMPVFKDNGENANKSIQEKQKPLKPKSPNTSSLRESRKTEQTSNLTSKQSISENSNIFFKPAESPHPNAGRRSPTFEMAVATFCARNPSNWSGSAETTSDFQNQMNNLRDLPRSEEPMETASQKVCIPKIPPPVLPRIPEINSRGWSSQNNSPSHHSRSSSTRASPSRSFTPTHSSHFSSSHHHCCSLHHQHHHVHHHDINPCSTWRVPDHPLDPSPCLHGRVQTNPCNSAFTPRHGCSEHCCVSPHHGCIRNECRFPVKKQFRQQSCSAHRSCSLRFPSEVPAPSTPVIVISFPGEALRRTIELRGFISPEEESPHPSTSMECESSRSQHVQACRTGKRHLEEVCCADYKQHCEQARQMAPSVSFLSSNLQETRSFDSHCPCCHQTLHHHHQQHHPSFDEEPKMTSSHFATHSYLNCDNAASGAQNALGHFEISPRSYTKLLAYIESTRVAAKRRPPGNQFTGRSSFHGFERRSFTPNNDLVFLNRKPVHATNEYSTLGEQMLNSSIYQNQTIADTLQLAQVLERVEECPWYWGETSNAEAKQILRNAPIGTFVLRDSSDPRYLFSVSVMTSRGPTSIRVVYIDGYFRFDSDGDKSSSSSRKISISNEFTEIPKHRQCVLHMILHYTSHLTAKSQKSIENINLQTTSDSSTSSSGETNENSADASGSNEQCQFMCSWMGRSGKKVMPVSISQPLTKNKVLSLKQLSRACVNKHLSTWKNPECVQSLPLSLSLQKYVRKYPYPV